MGEKTGPYTVDMDWSAGVDWTVVEEIDANGARVVFPLVCKAIEDKEMRYEKEAYPINGRETALGQSENVSGFRADP